MFLFLDIPNSTLRELAGARVGSQGKQRTGPRPCNNIKVLNQRKNMEKVNKRYQAKQIGSKQLKEQIGIIIWFDKTVEKTESKYTTGFKTLISKIGGFIGISKNFLWLMILFLSSIGVLMSQFKLHDSK